MENKKLRIGDMLIASGKISVQQLEIALAEHKGSGMRLGSYLVSRGFTTEEEVVSVLKNQLGIDEAELRLVSEIPNEIRCLVTQEILAGFRKNVVVPYDFSPDGRRVLLATADPLDAGTANDFAIMTGKRPLLRLARESEILAAIDRFFGSVKVENAVERYRKEFSENSYDNETETTVENDDDSAMAAVISSVIEQAVAERASDIHFDATENDVKIRFRIDGVLSVKHKYPKKFLGAMLTRVKILSGMDISEKRKPQDGRTNVKVGRTVYDIRVSTLPTFYGEKMVLRLALTAGLSRNLEGLGFSARDIKILREIINRPNGLVLVTGPTGSGKTTTLYSALGEINRDDVNIITVEDPVEANITGINQVAVNQKVGLNFANVLRSVLRQDPDVIMLGEIRDGETAATAVQASLTGHLVFSTLHTNSAAAAVARLLDMGVESYLLSDALAAVIAQRLVRRLCDKCKVSRKATEEEKRYLGISETGEAAIYDAFIENIGGHINVGCHACASTGYYGRAAIYEILTVTPEIRREIARGNSSAEEIVKLSLKRSGADTKGVSQDRSPNKTLRESAAVAVLNGTTSFKEILKIATWED